LPFLQVYPSSSSEPSERIGSSFDQITNEILDGYIQVGNNRIEAEVHSATDELNSFLVHLFVQSIAFIRLGEHKFSIAF
jgi:hypothetical protein